MAKKVKYNILKELNNEIEFLKEKKEVRKDSYLMRIVVLNLVHHDELIDILKKIKEKLRLEKVKGVEKLSLRLLLVIVNCLKAYTPVDLEFPEILFGVFFAKVRKSNKLYLHIKEIQNKGYEADIKEPMIEVLNIMMVLFLYILIINIVKKIILEII